MSIISVNLLQVKQKDRDTLEFQWNDGSVQTFTLQVLRDACPCAGCQGETVLLHSYIPPEPKVDQPGRYMLKSAELVGGYAIKFCWGDGHETGIYTWEHLRRLGQANG